MNKLILLILFSFCFISNEIKADLIEIEPLFEYPVAPEELESIQDKCDYLVKNFWNSFDFKRKHPVDQYALNEAFQVYSTSLRFADAKSVEQSIDKIVKNLSGNPVLLLQFVKAAEENLYGPRADFWSDPIYLKFVDAVIQNKKISESRKSRYISQANSLKNSSVGNVAPSFWFEDKERGSKQYFPMSTPTLLIFCNPDNTDWRIDRLRMDSNYQLTEALNKGKINVLFIIPNILDGWQNMVSNYNSHWVVGQSDKVGEIYDIRMSPSIYLVGPDGKILQKNLSADEAVSSILGILR